MTPFPPIPFFNKSQHYVKESVQRKHEIGECIENICQNNCGTQHATFLYRTLILSSTTNSFPCRKKCLFYVTGLIIIGIVYGNKEGKNMIKINYVKASRHLRITTVTHPSFLYIAFYRSYGSFPDYVQFKCLELLTHSM